MVARAPGPHVADAQWAKLGRRHRSGIPDVVQASGFGLDAQAQLVGRLDETHAVENARLEASRVLDGRLHLDLVEAALRGYGIASHAQVVDFVGRPLLTQSTDHTVESSATLRP